MKIHARDLVRIKKSIEKLEVTKSNLDGIRINLMTVSGQEAIMSAMKSAVGCYKQLNKVMDPAAMQKILAEYEKESMRQEIQQEIMDGVMNDGEDDGEVDELVQKTLLEIGVELSPDMVTVAGNTAAPAVATGNTADLSARLNNL